MPSGTGDSMAVNATEATLVPSVLGSFYCGDRKLFLITVEKVF